MSFHVQRIRTSDEPLQSRTGPIRRGDVRHSRTFKTAMGAQREADAWNGTGDFTDYGPTGWKAMVVPGRAPRGVA